MIFFCFYDCFHNFLFTSRKNYTLYPLTLPSLNVDRNPKSEIEISRSFKAFRSTFREGSVLLFLEPLEPIKLLELFQAGSNYLNNWPAHRARKALQGLIMPFKGLMRLFGASYSPQGPLRAL